MVFLCKNILQEKNKSKACWLPADNNSHFAFCRRCHLQEVSLILDRMICELLDGNVPKDISIFMFEHPFFPAELLHECREQSFLSLLACLYKVDSKLLDKILALYSEGRLQQRLQDILTQNFKQHNDSLRCGFYRYIYRKYPQFISVSHIRCWMCANWYMESVEPERFLSFIPTGMRMGRAVTPDMIHRYQSVFPYYIASLISRNYEDHIPELMENIGSNLCLDDFKKKLFTNSLMVPHYFHQKVPKELVGDDTKEEVYGFLKKRCALYKDELEMYAWHPSRVKNWCLEWDSSWIKR